VVEQVDDRLKAVFAASPAVLDSLWRVVDARVPSHLTLHPEYEGPEKSAGIYPVVLEPGSVAVLVLTWDGDVPNETDISAVVGLCGAALVRAWATRRVRELGLVMDALLDQASIGLAFVDLDLRYQHVNGRLASFHDRSVAEHVGRTVREMNPHLADQAEPLLRRVINTGQPTGKVELAGMTPDGGRSVVFEVAYLPVEVDGEIAGVAAVVDDVTESRLQLEELQQRYEFERSVAARLQRGLTPRGLPQPNGYEVAASYAAGPDGLGIGGDWYDVIDLGDNCFALVIGDVVGHGLDAAIAMVRLRHAVAGLAHAGLGPVDVLGRLDEYAIDESDQFVATLTYGLLDRNDGSITLGSAGHLPPLLVTEGSVDSVHTAGTPVGITVGERASTEIALGRGDSLVLYTDGVIEQRGESLAVSLQRLMDLVSKPFASAYELVNRIAAEAARHNNSDDAAVMVLRRN
jgi:PAS domain S-box-containing protein